MRNNGRQEKPLQGVVVCCTSIAPELRSQYADHVLQMGAEHKLDLTSEVTHLLVGDTDTPKYKYVAKERPDVRVMQPEWIAAVRKRWMADEEIDLSALERQYRVPTLAGLKICITGFDDLTFRAQLQKNILENGGQYTGDLTREVTHLIANRPAGKKFEYGTQWQKKIVSLAWYKDTLERGMQVDESKYHPSIPDEEQGRGAWNRARRQISPGSKRQRDDSQIAEQPRKLRRTASARFSSQNDTIWTDIAVKEPTTNQRGPDERLQVSRSVPDLKENYKDEEQNRAGVTGRRGIFSDKVFALQGFNAKHESILRSVLLSHGGILVPTLTELRERATESIATKLLLLPHQTALEKLPDVEDTVEVASELWVEHCMFSKKYFSPASYPLGRFLSRLGPPGFSKLTITSTGFSGIVPNHIAKIVNQLGAKYEQTFKADASVLVCNSHGQSRQKVELAQSWRIPVVSETWLWSCIIDNRLASLEKHALPGTLSRRSFESKKVCKEAKTQKTDAETKTSRKKFEADNRNEAKAPERPASATVSDHVAEMKVEETDYVIVEDEQAVTNADIVPDRQQVSQIDQARTSKATTVPTDIGEDKRVSARSSKQAPPVLRAISPNLSPQHPKTAHQKPKKRLFQPFDGAGSDTENREYAQLSDQAIEPSKADTEDVHNLNGEIRDLLELKSKLKERKAVHAGPGDKPRKQLMGRALSNLSNASSTSHVRQSRAGSVDSVNTDGLGREVRPSASNEGSKANADDDKSNPSFVGRAASKLFESRTTSTNAFENSVAANGEEDQWAEPAQEPALTQLVYEDPEEVLQSREKLAAKRRARSKLGQKDSDPKPARTTRATPAKRIKDDDLLVDAGWGAGRRTRNKASPAAGLKEF